MSLVINAPLIEGKLRDEAAQIGIPAEKHVEAILATHVGLNDTAPDAKPFYATATPEEWNAAFDAWIDSHPIRKPLPDAALSRESIYGNSH